MQEKETLSFIFDILEDLQENLSLFLVYFWSLKVNYSLYMQLHKVYCFFVALITFLYI